jgi:pimeloyl-ACP methyl ester carboxylesterase
VPPRGPETSPGRSLAGPDGRFLDVDGVAVHHRVAGPRDAPGVVLFHHFYGSVAAWRHVQDDLAGDHRVIAFDRVGFGLTDRPRRNGQAPNPYSREMATRIAVRLLDEYDVEVAALVGASAGGTVALETYAQAPDRVSGLALISPAITGDVGAPARLRPLLRTWPLRTIGPRLVRRLAGEVTRERVARSWHDPRLADDDDVDAYTRPMRVDGWPRGLYEVMTAEPPPDLRALLRTIDVPTLVVAGASDAVISPGWNRRTADAIPGARFHLLPDVGHTPHEERPDLLLPVLRSFLAGLGGGCGPDGRRGTAARRDLGLRRDGP